MIEKHNNKWIRYADLFLLAASVLLMLAPIWCFPYFVTGDGACHVYNAFIIAEKLQHGSQSFFNSFFQFTPDIVPNWVSHISLAILLQFFSPVIADKIFVSSYILFFVFSVRQLIKAINSNNLLLSVVFYVFIFHCVFQKGFYNYSLSIPLALWCISLFLKININSSRFEILIAILSYLPLCFTHPVGAFLYLFFLINSSIYQNIWILNYAGWKDRESKKAMLWLFSYCVLILSAGIYYCVALKNITVASNLSPAYVKGLLLQLTSLHIFSNHEIIWTQWIVRIFKLLFLYVFIKRMFSFSFTKQDIFLLLAVILYYFNLYQPAEIFGGNMFPERIQFLPYLFLAIWFVTVSWNKYLQLFIALLFFIINIGLTKERWSYYEKTSQAAAEYLSVKNLIPPHSTILPLSYCHKGRNADGSLLNERLWLFKHTFDYAGAERQLLMLDNYEGDTHHFPLLWKDGQNPYQHLVTDPESYDSEQPCINIENYETQSGKRIDYIVTWCLNEQTLTDSAAIFSLNDIKNKFELLKISDHQRTRLYKRKDNIPTM